jgi:hypothetical protein
MDPNRVELETATPQQISDTIIKKLSPKNGDVFFISSASDRMSSAEWDVLRRVLDGTLKSLNITCGLVLSEHEFKVTKESLGDVVRVEISNNNGINLEEKEKISQTIGQAILKDNRPIVNTPEGFNQALSGTI